jgi:ParB/RepB/Spo0J family partition protein
MAKAEAVKIKRSDFFRVPLSEIVVEDNFNVREDMGDIESLAKSLAKMGQKVPMIGKRSLGKFIVTAGHRRLAAAQLANEKFGANIETMDFMIGEKDDESRILTMLLDGEGAKALTNAEMVAGIDRLLKSGMKRKAIIDSLVFGDSQAQKYNLVKAAEAPEAIQDLLAEGVISVAKVNELQRKANSDEELIELAEQAVADKKAGKKAPKVNATVAKLEEALSLADPTTAKYAVVKSIVNRLKSGATAEDIAKLLK